MDSGYITALAALGGAALGGLTSFATSWTTLRVQMKAQRSASSNPNDKDSITPLSMTLPRRTVTR